MERSEQINELAKALAKAQGQMQSAKKESDNPFYKSKYADLSAVVEAIKKPLADNGLAISQLIKSDPATATVETLLMHESGQWLLSTIALTPVKSDPQGMGSAITYARRYGLSAIVGLASEDDDDGNAASKKPATPTATTAKTQPPRATTKSEQKSLPLQIKEEAARIGIDPRQEYDRRFGETAPTSAALQAWLVELKAMPPATSIIAPLATPEQIKKIQTLLTKQGIKDDFERHERVGLLLELESTPTSFKHLTSEQVALAINRLEKE